MTRNAEVALALALEGRSSRHDHETTSLLAVANALRALPEPDIDPVFASALEHRLLTEGLAETARPGLRLVEPLGTVVEEPVSDVVVSLPRRRLQVRRSFVAAAAVMSLAAMPVVAAAAALPGSPFYGLKQQFHAAQIAFLGDSFADAERRLGFAAGHISEAEQLVAIGASDARVGVAIDLATREIARAEVSVAGATDTVRLAAFAEKASATDQILRDAASILAPQAGAAFGRAMDASRSLQAAMRDALGVPAAPVSSSLGRHVEVLTTQTSGAAVEPSGSMPSTESAETSTKPADPKADSNEETNPTQPAGKAVNGAKSYGCSLPGQVELELVLGSTQSTCAQVSLP